MRDVIPDACASKRSGIQSERRSIGNWIPAFAGMTAQENGMRLIYDGNGATALANPQAAE